MPGAIFTGVLISSLMCFGQANEIPPEARVAMRANPLAHWENAKLTSLSTPEQWSGRRKQILRGMEAVMGDFPESLRKHPLSIQYHGDPIQVSDHIRRKISFEPREGVRIKAWLLIPNKKPGKREDKFPAVLCLHQTIPIGKDEPAGLGESLSKRQAYDLANRGFVCLAPDYPSFGEYPCEFKEVQWQSGSMMAIWNNSRAVDLLCSLPEVDPGKIGAIGHSLGGHNTLFTAVFEPRIKVAVTSCGFTSFPKYKGGDLTGWTSSRYMPRIAAVYGKDPAKIPFDFPEILGAIAPRGVFISAPTRDDNFDVVGVREAVQAALPVFKMLGAPEKLQLRTPEAGHDFPETPRLESYEYLRAWLSVESPGTRPEKQEKNK